MRRPRRTNPDFEDAVNIQSDLQNPHDGANRNSDMDLPKDVTEYVAECESRLDTKTDHSDAVNVQPETENPHDTELEAAEQYRDGFSGSKISAPVNHGRTVNHILDNSETERRLMNACELLGQLDRYVMVEASSDLNIVATSDGETFRIEEYTVQT